MSFSVIATGETHSVREFLDLAFQRVGLNWSDYVEIDPRYYRPAEVQKLLGDPSKAQRVLGWKAKVDLPDLVDRMIEHDRELARDERILLEARVQNRSEGPS